MRKPIQTRRQTPIVPNSKNTTRPPEAAVLLTLFEDKRKRLDRDDVTVSEKEMRSRLAILETYNRRLEKAFSSREPMLDNVVNA